MSSTVELSRIGAHFHLMAAALTGTEKHLREQHELPEDLIDTEDVQGMHADHAHLHGLRYGDGG